MFGKNTSSIDKTDAFATEELDEDVEDVEEEVEVAEEELEAEALDEDEEVDETTVDDD